MSYDHNNTYCGKCGSYGGCNCGYEYLCSSYSPDYNPYTTNNSVCPQVEGGSSAGGAGGTASGNNNNVHVSVGGNHCNCNQHKEDCCCKDGAKKLLNYLYNKALDNTLRTFRICLYGDIIPSDIIPTSVNQLNICSQTNSSYLLNLPDNDSIKKVYISNDVIKSINGTVSLCELSVIRFAFETTNSIPVFENINNDNELKKEFFYTPKCNCCCNCVDGIGQTLYSGLLGSCYNITLANTLSDTLTSKKITYGTLNRVKLIAINSDIAIFSINVKGTPSDDKSEVTHTIYFGVPTCRIAKFVSVTCP